MTKILIQTPPGRIESMNKADDAITEKYRKNSQGGGANTPPGWKPWKKVDEDEVDREVLHKTRNRRI